jgi:hypothetical protein
MKEYSIMYYGPRITNDMISAKGFDGQSPYIPDALQAIQDLQNGVIGNPALRGSLFVVDPKSGLNTNDGSEYEPFADLPTAYAACTDGAGDMVVLRSAGSTSAETTSYLDQNIHWTKSGISVFGIGAPVRMFGRARVANVERTTGAVTTISFDSTDGIYKIKDSSDGFLTAKFAVGQTINIVATSTTNNGNKTIATIAPDGSYITTVESVTTEAAATAGTVTIKTYNVGNILLSGANNIFSNIEIWNGGSIAGAIGGMKVTGLRNFLYNCHITGGAGCTPTANERSLELGIGAQDNNFVNCVFGTDTVDRGNNANCEILLAGDLTTERNEFINCKTIAQAEGGTAHGAIKSASAIALGRHMIFRDCDFMCYKSNLGSDQASVFIGTGLNTAKLFIVGQSFAEGYAAWDANAANNCVFATQPAAAASAGGGIPTTN